MCVAAFLNKYIYIHLSVSLGYEMKKTDVNSNKKLDENNFDSDE